MYFNFLRYVLKVLELFEFSRGDPYMTANINSINMFLIWVLHVSLFWLEWALSTAFFSIKFVNFECISYVKLNKYFSLSLKQDGDEQADCQSSAQAD